MNIPHYIGFDVHKKHINFCSRRANGELVEEGRLEKSGTDGTFTCPTISS